MAAVFARAAEDAGLERILYLGGLGEMGAGLSEHLASRREVEHVLASGRTPVTVLRAAMIIGSGSASFEILRYLVERLPVMITPRWVATQCQPIAVRNVVGYLVDALGAPGTAGRTLDVGGPDVVSYRELMGIMAEERGLRRRLVIPVPVLTPRLSSLWIQLVTPISRHIARPLAEGLKNRVVCRDREAQRLLPQELLGVSRRSARRSTASPGTKWRRAGRWRARSPATPTGPAGACSRTGARSWSRPRRRRSTARSCASAAAGAGTRWTGCGACAARWTGSPGAPGLRRGRRDADDVGYGEALDFWRVVSLEPARRLALRAEMKLPGEALLEFTIDPDGHGSRLTQTARFRPRGLAGLAYWYAVLPLHAVVFDGMLRGIARAAQAAGGLTAPAPVALIRGLPRTSEGREEKEPLMQPRRAAITALGTYVPERVLTNADLEKMVDTSDEWIRTRTGIRHATRRRAGHTHERDRGAGGQRGAAPARHRRLRAGPHHRRHRDARHALPGHRRAWSRTGSVRSGPGASTSRRPARASSTPSRRAPSSWPPAPTAR